MPSRIATLTMIAALSAAVVSADQRSGREQQILVIATLADGSPVTNMTEADFIVREDRLVREVTKVSPAPPPSHVLLLVDDSQAAQDSVPFLRTSLAAFIKKTGATTPAPQMALTTFGERPTKRADYSSTPAAVEQAAARIFSIAGSGAYFLQAIAEGCKDLKKRGATNPVIVAFVAEAGPEFSNDTHKQVAEALQSAHASLFVIVLTVANQPDRSSEEHERAAVLGDVVPQSGGMTRTVISTQGLDPAFHGIASVLTSRYLVAYGRPEQTIPPTVVEVTSKRPDVRLTSSRWPR